MQLYIVETDDNTTWTFSNRQQAEQFASRRGLDPMLAVDMVERDADGLF